MKKANEEVKVERRIKKAKQSVAQGWTGPEGIRRLRLPDFMTIGT